MDQILKELQSVPGVIGAFVYKSGSGVVAKDMPAVFKDDKLFKLGKSLVKIYAAGNMGFADLSDVSLFYEESIVVIRESVDQHYLVVFYDPEANLNLLSMSLNLVRDDLRSCIEDQANAQDTAVPAEVDVQKVNAKNNGLNAEELLGSSPMSDHLKAMQTSLAKVVGPIAKIIFIDALNQWIKTDEPSFSSISSLVDILGEEIGDPEKFREYKGRISPPAGQ